MLARSTSSRRRRASRSVAVSPQRATSTKSTKSSVAAAAAATTEAALDVQDSFPRSRRASVAVSTGSVPVLASRSPRNSIAVPQGSENNLLSVGSNRSRGSISVTDSSDLLHPGKLSNRSARSSFSEHVSDSLLMPGTRSARGSFSVSDGDGLLTAGSRSARGSFAAPDGELLLPPHGSRSARGSFSSPNSEIQISVSGTRSARASFSVPGDQGPDELLPMMGRSPRASFSMPLDRTLRGTLVPPELNTGRDARSPRGSISADLPPNRSPRGSICPDPISRSPRGSITQQEFNRSPRGSIAPEYNRSPRGSLVADNRSPRGSLGPDGIPVRSPRTSPRGSLPDASPRGSIGAAGLQYSPRGSVDLVPTGSFKGRQVSSGAHRLATRGENCESRRASSSVSQVSADDRRQLCEQSKLNPEAATGHTVYGSVVYQLKDANMEASGSCDFTFRALCIVFRTATVTIILVCLATLPLVMLIMGVNYLRDCPKEPHIPVYMVVGGSFGIIKMVWVIWSQIRSRRYERLDVVPPPQPYDGSPFANNLAARITSAALTLFLLLWFGLGNYWILRIYYPEFAPTLFDPNQWCSKPLYIFSLVHLAIVYCVSAAFMGLAIVLSCCYVFSCPLVVRYK